MAREGTEGLEPVNQVGGRRRRTRRSVALAAGLLAVSGIGYCLVSAPGSMAQAEPENASCTEGTGKLTVSEDVPDSIEAPIDPDSAPAPKAPTPVKASANIDFPNADCAREESGKSKTISFEVVDNSCVITAEIDEAEAKTASGGVDKSTEGTFELKVPLDGKPATAILTEKLTADSENASKTVTAEGTITGIKLPGCTAVPTGTFALEYVSYTFAE
ncbi:hypothetical protein [Nocardia sp. XZ_19_385]|uniref:hypothetical protein n=1 Tax=Nocardia sp. XZ_19_385 TaxID=2769488 RepID=UPI00188EB1ED|nr:hypothetical protein [Nocardia sp. XZ_19_385]